MFSNGKSLFKYATSGGCAAKIPAGTLREVLGKVQPPTRSELIRGPQDFEDAAAYRLPDGNILLSTVDFIPPVVDDPHTYGKIAAANALSDIYAMGGDPILALNLVCFPVADLPLDMLRAMVEGLNEKTAEAGAALGGGHSVNDKELKLGLSVNGLCKESRLLTNNALREGDVLILLKRPGCGPVNTGIRKGVATEIEERTAVLNMQLLNRLPQGTREKFTISSCTDVTGFGLIGHASEMARASKVHVELDLQNITLLPGALRLMEKGVCTKAADNNFTYASDILELKQGTKKDDPKFRVICDAETSGGLLLGVPEAQNHAFREFIMPFGFEDAATVGVVRSKGTAKLSV
ncbi:MAG: selenide, water dikinase SelD [Planctomycetota bacterium]